MFAAGRTFAPLQMRRWRYGDGAMPELVLATLNAKYIHASFGLRCLRANLGELRARSALAEFTIQDLQRFTGGSYMGIYRMLKGYDSRGKNYTGL